MNQHITEILKPLTDYKKTGRALELDACVEHVQKEIGFEGRYGWSYWAGKLKGLPYTYVLELVKEAKMKKQPGRYLTWKLSNKK